MSISQHISAVADKYTLTTEAVEGILTGALLRGAVESFGEGGLTVSLTEGDVEVRAGLTLIPPNRYTPKGIRRVRAELHKGLQGAKHGQ